MMNVTMTVTVTMTMSVDMSPAINIIRFPIITITARSIINGEAILKAPAAHLHLHLHLRHALFRLNRLCSIHGVTATLCIRPFRGRDPSILATALDALVAVFV